MARGRKTAVVFCRESLPIDPERRELEDFCRFAEDRSARTAALGGIPKDSAVKIHSLWDELGAQLSFVAGPCPFDERRDEP